MPDDATTVEVPRMMEMKGDLGLLFGALAMAQAAFGPIPKTREVTVRPKESAPYTFAYAPLDVVLDAVRPALNANGLAFVQPILEDGTGCWYVRSMLIHSSGAYWQADAPLPKAETLQKLGSAITYIRRYSAVGMLGVVAEEDDDGNAEGTQKVEARNGPRTNTRATPPAPKETRQANPQQPNGVTDAERASTYARHEAAKQHAAQAQQAQNAQQQTDLQARANVVASVTQSQPKEIAPPPPSEPERPKSVPPPLPQEAPSHVVEGDAPITIETQQAIGKVFKALGHTSLTPEAKQKSGDFLFSMIGKRKGSEMTEVEGKQVLRLAKLHLDDRNVP